MIPRGKLDIAYSDIFAGFWYCVADALKLKRSFESSMITKDPLLCLSVRSGFDLVLQALKLPPGSEILVTDINIPGMFQIIEAHQLVAVPLPVNKHSLTVSAEQLEAAIRWNTKAIIFTHLFGGIMELGELITLAKSKGLWVMEDCAQAYTEKNYRAKSKADVRMFSFGMIKTNTALGGALLQISNSGLCQRCKVLQRALPQQKRFVYFKKLCMAFLIKLLTARLIYSVFYRYIKATGKNADDVLSGFTRGFPGTDILKKIRFKPGIPVKRMLDRRLRNHDPASIAARQKFALEIVNNISPSITIGAANRLNSFWVLPIETENPGELINILRSEGFDATIKASSLVKLDPVNGGSHSPDELKLEKLIYLPMWPEMEESERLRLIEILNTRNQPSVVLNLEKSTV